MALSGNPICAIPHHLDDKYLLLPLLRASKPPGCTRFALMRIDAQGDKNSDDEMWRQRWNIQATLVLLPTGWSRMTRPGSTYRKSGCTSSVMRTTPFRGVTRTTATR